jgi:linoleate 10R-lipoxygenase
VGHGKPDVVVQPGDIVVSSYKNAHLNVRFAPKLALCLALTSLQPDDFPDPFAVNPRRPADSYHLQGSGFHECLGLNLSEQTIPEIIKVIFRLKNLRRAEGVAGRLAGFLLPSNGTDAPVYLDATGNITYWPGTMTLVVSGY